MRRALVSSFVLLTAATSAQAAMPDGPPPPLAQAWTPSWWSLLPLLTVAGLYASGLLRAPHSRAMQARETGLFAAGFVALGLALVWPLERYAAWFMSAHVAQHMLLLALAPPLLLAGRPMAVVAAALPRGVRDALHGALAGRPRPKTALAAATLVHVAVLWLWHLPGVVAAVLADEMLHRAMQVSVFAAGLWFWSAVGARLRAQDAAASAGAAVALATVMMLMGFLGALLTFAPRLLYPAYTDRALLGGVDPLRDQQLAGLLMWVPGALPYLVVGLWLVLALLRGPRDAASPGDAR